MASFVGEGSRDFFLPFLLEPAPFDPGTRWVKFYGRASFSGLRRTDGRLKRGTHGPTVYPITRVKKTAPIDQNT